MMMRAQGNEEAAAVLQKDLKRERKPPKPAAPKKASLADDPYAGFAEQGNRFERRQGREAKKAKRGKRSKKRT